MVLVQYAHLQLGLRIGKRSAWVGLGKGCSGAGGRAGGGVSRRSAIGRIRRRSLRALRSGGRSGGEGGRAVVVDIGGGRAPVLVIRLLRSKLTRWLRWGERRRMQPRWRLGRRQGSRVAPRQGGRRWGDVPASGGHRSLSRVPRGRRRTGRSALRRPLAWPGGCRCASGPACGAPVASSVAVAHLGTGGVFPPGGRVEWLL